MLTCRLFCRDEATRTPDPYVPNVVRYQLRYIPMRFLLFAVSGKPKSVCKGTSFFANRNKKNVFICFRQHRHFNGCRFKIEMQNLLVYSTKDTLPYL